jgi:hypothetical protein
VAPLAHDLGLPVEEAFTPEEQLDWLASELLDVAPPSLRPQEVLVGGVFYVLVWVSVLL